MSGFVRHPLKVLVVPNSFLTGLSAPLKSPVEFLTVCRVCFVFDCSVLLKFIKGCCILSFHVPKGKVGVLHDVRLSRSCAFWKICY
jgi:hypothetical protein